MDGQPRHRRPCRRRRVVRRSESGPPVCSADPTDPDHRRAKENRRAIEGTLDALGRSIRVHPVDPGATLALTHLNLYLTNGGGAIVPIAGVPEDEAALTQLAAAMPDRELIPVDGRVLHEGGGGPHCITQQVPAGRTAT
jgi:agmatine deiminase